VLELGRIEEAGTYALAPTASTTAMLALGDALALVIQEGRKFGPEDFAKFHPGGELGRQLLKVGELMRTGTRNPSVRSGATVLAALEIMTQTPGRPGATSVVDSKGKLIGFFTDGDLRRLIEKGDNPRDRRIDEVMTRNPYTISTDTFALEALALLHAKAVDQMPVVDAEGRLLGLLDVQDLLDLKFG
jgi:arabinose-5-phosphate isomerase